MDAQTICSLARQIAKCPNFTTQSGQLLNSVLGDLCQTYDFDVIRKTDTSVTLGTSTGSGPYALAPDLLRARINEVFYTINGVKYVMVFRSTPLHGVRQAMRDRNVLLTLFRSTPPHEGRRHAQGGC